MTKKIFIFIMEHSDIQKNKLLSLLIPKCIYLYISYLGVTCIDIELNTIIFY